MQTNKWTTYSSQIQNIFFKFVVQCYLPKDQPINAQYYSSLLVQLKHILKEKRRGKFTKGILFLHDNTPAHRALAFQKKLAYLGFQCLDHPPYSPDLALSDWTERNNWKFAIFLPTRWSLQSRRPGWTDKLLNFFWVACKSYDNGVRSLLSFVWSILNKSVFGHCSLFPSWSG